MAKEVESFISNEKNNEDWRRYENLPFEMIFHIFQYLPTNALIMASQVCRRWEEASGYRSFWRNCSVTVRGGQLENFLNFLWPKVGFIEALEIKYKYTRDQIQLRTVIFGPHHHLNIPCASPQEIYLLDNIIKDMKKLKCQKSLIYFEIKFLPETLKHLAIPCYFDIGNMRHIASPNMQLERFASYNYANCSETTMSHIVNANLCSLKHLSLNMWPYYNSPSLLGVFRCENLVSLCLFQAILVCPNDFNSLASLRNLKYLHIDISCLACINLNHNFQTFSVLVYLSMHIDSKLHLNLCYLVNAMPKLKTLCIELIRYAIDPLPIIDYRETLIENIIIRNKYVNPIKGLDSELLNAWGRLRDVKPVFNICICNAKFFYEFDPSNVDNYELYRALRTINFGECTICHLYYSPFLCSCN